jgi:hypothetical protein
MDIGRKGENRGTAFREGQKDEPRIMIPLVGVWAVTACRGKRNQGSRNMMMRIMKGGSADVVYVSQNA